ncbi:MAG: AI-2E family transporter [Flavipsychrobacter sp.]|nr:AI-2E family transporter [Flavipsychrobacter sp.]
MMLAPDTGTRTGKVLYALQVVFFGAAILYFGRTLFIPASFGLLVAIVMYPVSKWLERRRWPRSLAISLCLTLVVGVFGLLIWLLSLEMSYLVHDIPALAARLSELSPGFQQWIYENLGIPYAVQQEWLARITGDLQGSITGAISSTLNATLDTVFMLIMIPVFAALFLYQREAFVRFLELATGKAFRGKLHLILRQTSATYFGFIKGTAMVYLIVGVLNSIGLLALGIPHAILYGMLTAFMTVIPYVGILISALLPISTAIITKDSMWYPAGIIGIFGFVQYLEANVIFPRVVATQLNVSTWATLVAIIAGTILWGVAGMILFIPFVAIFKIVSDHVEEWKAVNVLLSR